MTALTGRSLDDTYLDLLQLSNSNTGITTTRTAIEDGQGTTSPLKLSSTTHGADGRVFVDLDSTSTDLAATLEALDTTAINHLVIDKPGTYVTGPWTINNLRALTIGDGVVLQFKASQGNDATMLDIARDDFTLHLLGTIDGNRDNQGSATNQRLVHSLGYDRVKVIGYNRAGFIKEAKGYGVWLRDGDELQVDGVRFEETDYECVSMEARTASFYRAKIINCWGDRSAQSSTANSTGVFKITASGAGGKWYDSEIRDCDAKMSATADNVAIEIWSSDSGGIIGCGLINNATDGAGAGIGQSIAKGVGCQLKARRAINAALGLELADCIESEMSGGHVDCAGITSSIGATIDNTNVDGYGNAIHGVFVKSPAATGISLVGTSYGSVVEGCRVRMSAAGAGLEAILNDGGVRAIIRGNYILVSGTATRGIVNDVAGTLIEGNSVTVSTGYGIVHLNANYVTIRGNHLIATGTGTAAYDLTDCQYCECTGGTISGTWTNGCNLVTASGTLDHNVVGGWIGDGGSASINTVNGGGTWGTHNRSIPIEGWLPGNGEYAAFARLAASYTDWVWESGILTGAVPTSAPLFGGNGSMIKVIGDGTAGNNVPWVLKAGTWTAIV